MRLDTNVLKPNQIFKNYKELCAYLGEESKKANSKKAQLKEWERYFSFRKEGQKIIITEVFETPRDKIDNRGGNNNKNVRPMMGYIMSTFNPDYLNRYHAISTWSTFILHLLDREMCSIIYRDDETVAKYCEKHHLPDQKLFREYVETAKFVTKSLITTAFRCLERNGLIEYQQGYKFYYEGADYNKVVATDALNEYIDNMEREICQKIKDEYFPNKNIKGKQLVYILYHSNNKELIQLYTDLRMQRTNEDNNVLCKLNDTIWEKDACSPDYIDGENKRFLSYYKAFMLTAFDNGHRDCNNRQEVVDKIIEMSIKRITGIKYKLRYGEEYHPYDNKESLMEIERINKILFKKTDKKISPIVQEEILNEYELSQKENIAEIDFNKEANLEELDEIFPIAS